MEKNKFNLLLRSWTKDPSLIGFWAVTTEGEKMIKVHLTDFYHMIKTMWFEHREVFPNKGTYKMIRRNLIRTIALTLNETPFRWRFIPDELCKEILHKLYQRWIPIRNLNGDFKTLLFYKASKIGFHNRFAKRPCFINNKLNVVFSEDQAVGIAHFMQNKHVEILFLRPIAVHDNEISMSKAKKIISEWNKNNFPKLFAYLPSFATCCLANIFLGSENQNVDALISDCYASCSKGRAFENIILNRNGFPMEKSDCLKAKKVFVSIVTDIENFKKLNPSFSPIPFISDYINRWE